MPPPARPGWPRINADGPGRTKQPSHPGIEFRLATAYDSRKRQRPEREQMNQSDDASGKAKPTYTRGIVTGILLVAVCVLVYVVVVRVSAPHHADDDAAAWLLKNTRRPVGVKLVSGEIVVKA